jgi:hypothetical protein
LTAIEHYRGGRAISTSIYHAFGLKGIGYRATRFRARHEEHIKILYSEELNEAGYDVITAKGGDKLIERIEEEQSELVFRDTE